MSEVAVRRPLGTASAVARTLAILPILLMIGVGIVPWAMARVDPWTFAARGWQVAGAALVVLATATQLWAALTLAVRGRGTPIPIDPPRELVIAGPYRHLRAPMALSGMVQVTGAALLLGSPLVFGYLAAVLLGFALVVLPAEERGLEVRFGAAFTRYRRRVRLWRPRWRGYHAGHEAREPALSSERTTPPGRWVLLYDGHCKFCTAQSKHLLRLARRGAIEVLSFQEPGVLERFPGVTHEACMRSMHLVSPEGRVYEGMEAAVKAVSTRRWLAPLAHLYYLPGVRAALDGAYQVIAANRYRLMGKAVAAGECSEACAVHLRPRR